MQAKTDRITPAGDSMRAARRPSPADAASPFAAGSLLIPGLFLVLFLSPLAPAGAAARQHFDNRGNLDSRWLPWIGSWQLVSNTVNESDSNIQGEFLLTIRPGNNRQSVVMAGSQDGTVLFDGKIVTVGSPQPAEENTCKGSYEYSWSDTGKRLLFNSKSTCADGSQRNISGISIFTGRTEWSDIQLMQDGGEKVITIRRYSAADSKMSQIDIKGAAALNSGRIDAGTNFSIDEIIELTRKVAPDAMEAALIEMRKPFPLNAKTLERLDDAGVPSEIVDLMVAFTYPDKFVVERNTISPAEKPEPGFSGSSGFVGYPYPWLSFAYLSPYNPLFPFYYAYSSLWWYGSWYYDYPFYWRPSYYPGGGYGIDRGRLIAGEGYSKVRSGNSNSERRIARPRNGATRATAGGGRGTYQGSGGTSASGGSYGASAGSSGGGSGAGSSGGGSPSASPAGYSGGGGGGQAKPR